MDLCEIHVFNVVGRVIVLDLAAGPGEVSPVSDVFSTCSCDGCLPVQTLDLDRFAVLDGGGKGD